MRYFIGKDGKQLGPFSEDQVRAKLATGEISHDDLGWHEGMSEWKPLRTLFATFGGTPAMPPGFDPSPAPFHRPAAGTAPDFDSEPQEFEPALGGRGSRLGAYLLDQLFVFILALPGIWQLLHPFMEEIRSGNTPKPEQLFAQIAPALPLLVIPIGIFVIVQIVLLVKRGQTVGKMLLGLRIVKLDGSNPGFVSVILLRNILPAVIGSIPMIGGFFSIINIMLIFREDRRCIHDLMAGTIVVEA